MYSNRRGYLFKNNRFYISILLLSCNYNYKDFKIMLGFSFLRVYMGSYSKNNGSHVSILLLNYNYDYKDFKIMLGFPLFKSLYGILFQKQLVSYTNFIIKLQL